MNESNDVLLRLIEKSHIENSEIIRKVRNLETGTRIQASVRQKKKAWDQAQTENNYIKLRIHAIKKESQNSSRK